jgi:hypothetical protein
MRKLNYALALGFAFAVCQFTPVAAQTRLFVSGQGSDSYPCSLGAPCRSFQRAHDVAVAGSEIAVLDTAGYGAVHITKSISIVNPGGVEAGISVPSGQDAITIDAGSGGTVNLRGLTLDGLEIGRNGVTINSAATVSIEQSVIRHFTQDGVYSSTTTPSSPVIAYLFVTDTLILDNGRNGVYLLGQSGSAAKAVLTRVQAVNNGTGMAVEQGSASGQIIWMTIADSTAAHNNTGIAATGIVSSIVKNCSVADNNTGLLTAGISATIILSKTSITAGVTSSGIFQKGWNVASGTEIDTTGDNLIYIFDETGSITSKAYE